MLVKYWMSREVIAVNSDDTLETASKWMNEKEIHFLPVMVAGNLVGVITERDVKRALGYALTTLEGYKRPGEILPQLKIASVMRRPPITVPQDYTVEEAAAVLLEHNIRGVPVTDRHGFIAGVITRADIFKALISLTGLKKRGIQFCLQVEDRPGSIKEVSDVIRRYGGRMASILSTYDRVPNGFRKVYIRMYNIERTRMPLLKEDLRRASKLIYMVDLRESIREIYD